MCAYTKAHGRHDAVVMHWRLMGFEQELVLTVYCSRPPRRELLNSRESLLAVATMEAGQTKRLNVPTRTHQTKRVNSYTTTRPGGKQSLAQFFHFGQISFEFALVTKRVK